MDIFKDKHWPDSTRIRIKIERAGIFFFEPALDVEVLRLPLQRVSDAQRRFRKSPLSQVANELEKDNTEFVVSFLEGMFENIERLHDRVRSGPAVYGRAGRRYQDCGGIRRQLGTYGLGRQALCRGKAVGNG